MRIQHSTLYSALPHHATLPKLEASRKKKQSNNSSPLLFFSFFSWMPPASLSSHVSPSLTLLAVHCSKTTCVRWQSLLVPCQRTLTGSVSPGCPAVDKDPIGAFSAVQSPCRLHSMGFLSHLSKMEKCPLGISFHPWPPFGHPKAIQQGSRSISPRDQGRHPGMCNPSGYHSASLGSQARVAKELQRIRCCLCPWVSTIQRLFPCGICSDDGSKKPQ